MARLARAEIFDPAEIVAVHLIGKTVRSSIQTITVSPSALGCERTLISINARFESST